MTYYQRLVQHAAATMRKFPRSTVALDAEDLSVIARGKNPLRVARCARRAVVRGRTAVIVENPRQGETWIL